MATTTTWTLREIARVAGRPVSVTGALARALVPGYRSAERSPARIPAEVATDVSVVLRTAACSPKFAELIKADPATAREGIEALARLIDASEQAATTKVGEEAPAA